MIFAGSATNISDRPIIMDSAWLERKGKTNTLNPKTGRLLNPDEPYSTGHVHTTFEIPENHVEGAFIYDVTMHLICIDVLGIGKHHFSYSGKDGLRYKRSRTFVLPPTMAAPQGGLSVS
jgi:hypothetical protein